MTPRDVIANAMDDDVMMYGADHENADTILAALKAAGYAVVPVEPTEPMKRAAFGPIMHGGRGGPLTSDFLRQEAALGTWRKMIEAAAMPADQS